MLSKTGIHTLRALAELAKLPEGAYAGAAEVAERVGAPPNYLAKLLQTLANANVLVSQKGKGGGFRLNGPAADLDLEQALEPVERFSRWNGCILGRERCSERKPCALHVRWQKVRSQYMAFLADTSVADLVE